MAEHIDYWIGEGDGWVAVFYRNNDTEASVLGASQRRGPLRVLRCRLWALRNGCGWPRDTARQAQGGQLREERDWAIARERDRERRAWETDRALHWTTDGAEELVERANQAEAQRDRLSAALREIDSATPSKDQWHRMGDSMWANIGRAAARIARRALSERPPDE